MPLPQKRLIPSILFALMLAAIAAPPIWWSAGDPPVIDPAAAVNNKGPANIGQAKHMAKSALDTLSPICPAVADQIAADLALIVDFTVPEPKTPEWLEKQKAPLLIGQLKAIAAPFYTHLNAADATWLEAERITNGTNYPNSIFPWTAETTDDANKAMANIGQLKSVFSLRFETLIPVTSVVDSDSDGLLDTWEQQYFGSLSQTAANDYDGDTFSNMMEFYQGSNPSLLSDTPKGMIASGTSHSLALTANGRVWTWGYNSKGQLGDGTTTNRLSPVLMPFVSDMAKIVAIDAAGYFSMALDENGTLWGWGDNNSHQISRDDSNYFKTPVKIHLPAPIVRFACGDDHSLAVDRNGKLWAWGSNSNGQLGAGHNSNVLGVIEVTKPPIMSAITFLEASKTNSYLIDAAGRAWAWGANGSGQIGDASNTSRYSPVEINTSTGFRNVQSITSGELHSLALTSDGSLWSWGYNNYGQLGSGNTTSSNKPLKNNTLLQAKAVAAGGYHSLAVSASDQVWAWGRNSNGQLGLNSTTSGNVPALTTTVSDWSSLIRVSGGTFFSIALKSDSSLWTWGLNTYGQLGHGNATQLTVATKLANLKLAHDDSDADTLADSWELFYYGNLTNTGTDTGITNGVSNSVAHALGLNPIVLDNDDDGISDVIEISYGLDPLDWADATGDMDGDRIPNLWELFMADASYMNNSNLKPTVSATVSPSESIQTKINALPANSTNPPWYIVQVQPSVYKENVTLPVNKRILLIPATSSGIPEIQGATTSATISIYGESVVDGFRITHAKGIIGNGIDSSPSNGRNLVRIVNCLIHENSDTYGAGIYTGSNSRTVIAHCSIFGNTATSQGNALYASGNMVRLINSICSNPSGAAPQEIFCSSTGTILATQSIVQDGSVSGTLLLDPLLNPRGLIKAASPARNLASLTALAPIDIHGETRGSLPDIGADHFLDTDGDLLPDWLESLGATSPSEDYDSDGLTNLIEYEAHGSNPIVADTDGDELNDGAEITAEANLFDPDSDSDEMKDGDEVLYGFNPTNDEDALQDNDGDRVPNVYEIANGKNPTDSSSVPLPHITIDKAIVTETAAIKKTIQAGINDALNTNRFTIIRVKPNIYPEALHIDNNHILFLADLGAIPTVIAPTSGEAAELREKFTVLDGFTIRRGATTNTNYGLYINADSERDQVRIVNCTVTGFSANTSGAAYLVRGKLTVAHCTIMDNSANINGRAFNVQNAGRLLLQNSIVWNPQGTASQQIYQATPGNATALSCIILGGELGSISTAPMTDHYYCLMPGSPALGAGTPLTVSSQDCHGETRPTTAPDIGADQRMDSDSDNLPDWWEIQYFGNLTQSATSDNDTILDKLTNYYEYLLGYDPTNPDTLGNLNGDLYNAVFTTQDPYYPLDWLLDGDYDSLSNGEELYYGTNPTLTDTNADGLCDGLAILVGISATSLDTDADTISNAQEILNGTNPLLIDSDGDGVQDNLDAFPLDVTRSQPPNGSASDTTPPVISLLEPIEAVLVP